MQQALRYEAEYFDEKKRLLRAIFNETLAQCADAYRSKNISKDKFQEMGLKSDDERYIRNMIDNPISIVLMGNRPCVKARIVNYILGYELLPVFGYFDPDFSQPRRSVRILYGAQRRHAFCIRHFELLECAPSHTERVVSFEDLRLEPVVPTIGIGGPDVVCSSSASMVNASNSLDTTTISSTTTSGLESGSERSLAGTTISLNSSTSIIKSHPLTNGAANSATSSSSVFSSHCTQATGKPVNYSYTGDGGSRLRHSNMIDDDDDEADDGEMDDEYGDVNVVNEMTTMEIVLPHELLEKNLQIRVAPDVDNFDTIYRTTFYRTNPIIIYCFERYDEKLNEVDIGHLDQLRQLMPSTPVLFAHIVDFDPTYHTCMMTPSHHPHHHQPTPPPHYQSAPHHHHMPQSDAPPASSFHPSNQFCSNNKANSGRPHSATSPTPLCSCNQRCDLTESEQQHHQQQWMAANQANVSGHCRASSQQQQQHHHHHHYHHHQCSQQCPEPTVCGNVGGDVGGQCSCFPPTSEHTWTNYDRCSSSTDKPPESGMPSDFSASKKCRKNSPIYSHQHQHCPTQMVSSAVHYHGSNGCDNSKSYLRASESLWNQLREMGFFRETPSTMALQGPLDRQQKRLSNGYYIINDRPFKCAKQNADYGLDVSSRFICHSYEFCYFVDFFRAILKSNLVVASTLLNEIHNQFIQYYIFSAFDMTWSLNYSIPKRLEYARSKEAELYMSLMGIANRKQEEIRQLIGETLEFMREDILNHAYHYQFSNPCLNKHPSVSAANVKDCIEEIQEFVFVLLNRAIAVKLISSVDVMRESFIGTLERCLKMLENFRPDTDSGKLRNEDKIDFALSRLLNLAYSIEINANTCNSILRIFWERMKGFFLVFSFAWRPNCVVDGDWKRKVAADLIDNLSEAKLAKCICTQFREKLKLAHETFVSSLGNLESVLMSKMKETDHRRQQVRKNDAPLFARLALESTSFIDAILYGSPELSKEIGRGQYGVVFSTKKSWGHYSRIAVKSIMICDDKHWNDLSMEFYYTRSLPENDRIVQIRGSIIEHNYNGSSSYVYLIMDRMNRDLYAGLKTGLDWLVRLQIALDVVHGLRFLHNHGLIHRDIKLKNVLLDRQNRAKITDLGFCKSEVMISGSIVGTPIHMAPEVFTGKYDSMVDVYAFGILFWYICAGSIDLPQIFEQCHNKDHLWIAVKKGLRPERLPLFDDQCFSLMERCWSGDPTKRPLLGEVEQTLLDIKQRFSALAPSQPSSSSSSSSQPSSPHSKVAPKDKIIPVSPQKVRS